MPVSMTPREQAGRALYHQEPDRVPLDLGATAVKGLTIQAYQNLRRFLNIHDIKPVLLSKSFQLAEVDEQILHLFEVDCHPIFY